MRPVSVEKADAYMRLMAGFAETADELPLAEDFDTAEPFDYDDPSETAPSLIEHLNGICVWCDKRFDPSSLARGQSRLYCSEVCSDADLADVTAEVLAEDARARAVAA